MEICRYFSLEHFLNLLDLKMLHFTRLSCFSDINEGLRNNEWIINNIEQRDKLFADQSIPKIDIKHIRTNHEKTKVVREKQYASCWTTKINECMALWSMFANNGLGILVYSSTDSLRSSLDRSKATAIAEAGSVLSSPDRKIQYRPHNILDLTAGVVDTAFEKNQYYDFEHEYRFLIDMKDYNQEVAPFEKTLNGILVPLKGLDFIEKVLIGYKFDETVKASIAKSLFHMGLPENKIHKSIINSRL